MAQRLRINVLDATGMHAGECQGNLGGHLRDSTPAAVSDRVTTCRQAKLERVSESDVRTSISFHNGKRNRLLARPTERHSSTQT